MTKGCPTNLLQDRPSAEDIFGGSHERVSSAMGDLIESEQIGRPIALTGPWGSGKSSILHMLQKRLTKTADVFIFDAWAHEGDPLRRAFLERLIDFLWASDASQTASQLKSDLLLRKKTKEEISTPVLTTEAKAIGLSVLVVPAGLALFTAVSKMQSPPLTYLTVALILTMLPVIILLFIGGASALHRTALQLKKRLSKHAGPLIALALMFVALLVAFGLGHHMGSAAHFLSAHRLLGGILGVYLVSIAIIAYYRPFSRFAEVFPLLLNKTITTNRSESIESVEPSSIEFQRWFASIVKTHKAQNKGRRLVIAIDNLDRIAPELAAQLWATMRTFFEFDFDPNPWADCVWLIAAFDTTAIKRLWNADEADRPRADSFIDKTFQVSFVAPPLILLNRGDYLLKQLQAAFPSHNVSQFERIVQLYDFRYHGEGATPRDVTKFVNRIGSIHRQWADEIPLVQQALYVIASTDSTDILGILSSVSRSTEFPPSMVGDDLPDALAAIHFNVPKKDSAHTYMSHQLLSSLITPDPEILSRLASIKGFSRVLTDVVIRNSQVWRNGSQSQSLTNAILALDSLEAENDGISTAWQWWIEAASSLEKWEPVTERTGLALSILAKRTTDEAKIQKLLKSAGQSMPRASNGSIDESHQSMHEFVINMKPLFESLPGLPLGNDLQIEGSGRAYLNLLGALSGVMGYRFAEVAQRVSTNAKDSIADTLAETVENADADSDFPRLVKVLSKHKMRVSFMPMIYALKGILSNTNNNLILLSHKVALEAALVVMEKEDGARAILENLANGGFFLRLADVAGFGKSNQGSQALLLQLLFHKSEQSEYRGEARVGWSFFDAWTKAPLRDPAINRRVAEMAKEFGLEGLLLEKKKITKELEPLISAILLNISK
jgi:hypothetical protein